jgi:S1-C subfamily serine protease
VKAPFVALFVALSLTLPAAAQNADSAAPPPLAAPTAAPPPVAAPPAPAPAQWLKAVYEQVADSVVLIETEYGTGSGFFFRDGRLVATALHVVDDAETIIVGTSDGRRQLGRVVAYSRLHDLALVQLEFAPPRARVLEPFTGVVEIGQPVVVIGHPFSGLEEQVPELRGLLNWSMTQGVVSAVAGSWLQTDAAINPGNSGGPIVNERGQVLGIVSATLSAAQGISVAARVHRLGELLRQIGTQPPPRHTWRFDGMELAFVAQVSDDSVEGVSLGTGMRLLKHFPFRLRLGYLAGSVEPDQATIVATRLQRFTTELSAGYAFMIGRVELSPYLGGAFFYDNERNSVLRIDTPTVCTHPPCVVDGKVVHSNEGHFRVLPMAGLSLDVGSLRLGYAYQLALGMSIESQHRILVGLTF